MTRLSKDNNDDNDSIDPVKDKILEIVRTLQAPWLRLLAKFDALVSKLPPSVVETWEKFSSALASIRLALLSFIAGAVIAGAALLVPIYSAVESLSQPVTLFETILGDLEQAYVDEVDTSKLFEVGVNAMLQSLDPYTEFEGPQEAVALNESIDGKYGGVGLVIAGTSKRQAAAAPQMLPKAAKEDQQKLQDGDMSTSNTVSNADEDEDDDEDTAMRSPDGIRVVSAMEGYAFDYGLRVGDKLRQIDEIAVESTTTVEDVRNALRGEPGTMVNIQFEREGVEGVQSITMPRAVVRIRDVKLATLVGNPKDGIGYIQLSGFASDAGRETRNAIRYLQQSAEDQGTQLNGLVLDLRGNPGGLLTSAVDVASLLVPKGSDIVSAKGRGFPGVLYRSRVDPILESNTKLAVLVNGGTASAAEIVSGAVQDLDIGIIVGSDRTFGKGLVQNVEELPFNTALKFTVAKYYTPSGRCIQGVNYKEGGGSGSDNKYVASKVADKDRNVYYTRNGRAVRDGGGVEADYKVSAPKASALEITLLRSGVMNDFAADWSKKHELTSNFEVDEDTYRQFISFVNDKQHNGEIQLEALYSRPLSDLKKALKKSGYKGSEKEVENLQQLIVREVQKDFEKYRSDIKEDISQSILARYLPESMLIERGVASDVQVQATVKLLTSGSKYEKLLAKGSRSEQGDATSSVNLAASDGKSSGYRSTLTW